MYVLQNNIQLIQSIPFCTTIILFTFEHCQVISGFTWTVAANSLPDAIRYFVQPLWDVFMKKLLWVYKLEVDIQQKFWSNVLNVPTFLAIAIFNFPTLPLHSSPVKTPMSVHERACSQTGTSLEPPARKHDKK